MLAATNIQLELVYKLKCKFIYSLVFTKITQNETIRGTIVDKKTMWKIYSGTLLIHDLNIIMK